MKVQLRPWQDGFIYSPAKFSALVSAWGTGKTLSLILKAVRLSEEHPHNLGIIFRKEFEDLRDSTMKDFEEYTGMKINYKREANFANGSIIMFRHLEEMRNLQNLNLGFFGIEQAEEMDTEEGFMKLLGRLRRKGVGTQQGFIIANTKGHNWIYNLWKMEGLKQVAKDLRLTMDVPLADLHEARTQEAKAYLDEQFLVSLEILKKKRPKLYNRFVLNSWEDEDTEDIVIPLNFIEQAAHTFRTETFIKKIVAIDPSHGGDEFVMDYLENTDIKEQHILPDARDSYAAAARCHMFAIDKGAHVLAIDSTGLGAPIADFIRHMANNKYIVHEVNFSETAFESDRFPLRRDEIWWKAAEMFINGEITLTFKDDFTQQQLSAAKYDIKKGKMKIESKDEMKKRIGSSPNRADAYLVGLDAYRLYDAKQLSQLNKNTAIEQFRKKWHGVRAGSAWAA